MMWIMTNLSPSLWDKLVRKEDPYEIETRYRPLELPRLSVVIPTTNSAQVIRSTLDSLLAQDYPHFEIIIVDCSEDRTLEIVKSYRSEKIRIYSVAYARRYEMLNKGLSQAEGEYVNFLFPGDFFLYRGTLKQMMTLALDSNRPHLVYCGTLLRDLTFEAKILYRELTLDLLKKGQQPTSLQSCWFLTDTLREIGKFNSSYSQRGGFELLCRLTLDFKGFRFASIKRVLTDYDLRSVTRRMIIVHFWETMITISRYFGFFATLHWLFFQKDIYRFFKLWMHSLKVAFSGR